MSLDIPYANTASGAGVFLAPNLTFPDDVGTVGYISAGITTSSSLGTVLSLTGKFIVDYLRIIGQVAESTQIRLTVDSIIVWDDTNTSGTTSQLAGLDITSGGTAGSSIACESSFLLEMSKATDTAVTLNYLARPIL